MIKNLFKLFHFKLCEPQFSFTWEHQMKYWTHTEAHLSKEKVFLLTFLCQSTSSVFISPSFSVYHCLLNLKVKCLLFSLKPLLFLLLSVYTGGANQFGFGQSARAPSGFMHTNPPILLNTHLPLYAHLYLPRIPFCTPNTLPLWLEDSQKIVI